MYDTHREILVDLRTALDDIDDGPLSAIDKIRIKDTLHQLRKLGHLPADIKVKRSKYTIIATCIGSIMMTVGSILFVKGATMGPLGEEITRNALPTILIGALVMFGGLFIVIAASDRHDAAKENLTLQHKPAIDCLIVLVEMMSKNDVFSTKDRKAYHALIDEADRIMTEAKP